MAVGDITQEGACSAGWYWYITSENTSDGVSLCLNQDKETKMSQRQLNTVLPHLELQLLDWGNLSTQIRPAEQQQDSWEAHLLWHQHQHRVNRPHSLKPELIHQVSKYMATCFSWHFWMQRNDLSMGLCSVLWWVVTASPLSYTTPHIMILNKKYKSTKITNGQEIHNQNSRLCLFFGI